MSGAMTIPFPKPGAMLRQAFKELEIAAYGTDEQKKALGDPTSLPRPWDPGSVTNPKLREQLWLWLDHVTVWLNHEYGWRAEDLVPACWPRHPYLVREIAVLADQRRRAGAAVTSDGMEEWHRYALPAFTDRMSRRARGCDCAERHQDWPARGPYTRHVSDQARQRRGEDFAADLAEIDKRHQRAQDRQERERSAAQQTPPLRLVDSGDGEWVDPDTGEVIT